MEFALPLAALALIWLYSQGYIFVDKRPRCVNDRCSGGRVRTGTRTYHRNGLWMDDTKKCRTCGGTGRKP